MSLVHFMSTRPRLSLECQKVWRNCYRGTVYVWHTTGYTKILQVALLKGTEIQSEHRFFSTIFLKTISVPYTKWTIQESSTGRLVPLRRAVALSSHLGEHFKTCSMHRDSTLQIQYVASRSRFQRIQSYREETSDCRLFGEFQDARFQTRGAEYTERIFMRIVRIKPLFLRRIISNVSVTFLSHLLPKYVTPGTPWMAMTVELFFAFHLDLDGLY